MPQSLRDAVLERVRALGVRSTSAYFRRLALADLAGRQREFPRGGSDEDRARAAEWLRREAGAEAGS